MPGAGFLSDPEPTPEVEAMLTDDLESDGYVMNLTRVWAHAPEANAAWASLVRAGVEAAGLTFRQRGIVISALAGELGDAYCALAWGSRLAKASDAETAAGVLTGDDRGLDSAERPLAAWARRLVDDPSGTTAAEVQALRDAGFDDRAIVGLTVFAAARIAFCTVNDALGALPDAELAAAAPTEVRDAVTWGRPPEA